MSTPPEMLRTIKSIFHSMDTERTGKIPRTALIHTIKEVGFSEYEASVILDFFGSEPELEYNKFLEWVWEHPDVVSGGRATDGTTTHAPTGEPRTNGVYPRNPYSSMSGSTESDLNAVCLPMSSPETDSFLGDPLRTVSAHYLATHFVKEVANAGHDVSAKVYEIEETVLLKKGANIVCPRDERKGAAYCDCVHGEQNVGMAKIMLSYTWAYKLSDIIDTVMQYCSTKAMDPMDTYIWMCCFCINQHRVREMQDCKAPVPFEAWQAEFGSRVTTIGRLLAVMDCWEKPQYIDRMWCIFELFTALDQKSQGCVLDIVMPQQEAAKFAQAIADSGSGDRLDSLWKSLSSVNVEAAGSTYPSDRENILKLIQASVGCSKLNHEVVVCLQAWFADTAENNANESLEGDDLAAAVGSCTASAHMLVQLTQFDRAQALLDGATKKLKASGQIETPLFATVLRLTCLPPDLMPSVVLRHCGVIARRKGSMPQALAYYEKAQQLLKDHSKLFTDEGAKLLTNLGNAQLQDESLQDTGLDTLKKARSIGITTGWMNTVDGAYLLVSISAVMNKKGNHAEALEQLRKAWEVVTNIDNIKTPVGATISMSLGNTLRDLKRLEESVEHYAKSLSIFEAVGTLATAGGAGLLDNYGTVEIQLHKVQNGREKLLRSRDAFERLNMSDRAAAVANKINKLQ